jgi:outer membrane cobalamin receptor
LIQNELDGYFDANIGVEYLYNSRLSAFVQVYNLINTPNTLFLGYDAQGVNVLFGIAYQF